MKGQGGVFFGRRGGKLGLNFPAEEAAPAVPLGGDDVSVFVVGEAVGGGGDAVAPVFWLDFVGVGLFGVGVGTEAVEGFSLFVEDGDAAGELGDGDVFAVEVYGAGAGDAGGVLADHFTLEGEVDEAVVGAVTDEDAGWLEAVVEGEFVGGVEVPRVAFSGGGFFKFSGFAEDEEFAGGVAVYEEDVAVWGDVCVGEGEGFSEGFWDVGEGDF